MSPSLNEVIWRPSFQVWRFLWQKQYDCETILSLSLDSIMTPENMIFILKKSSGWAIIAPYCDIITQGNLNVYSTAHSGWQRRKYQSSASLALCGRNPPVSHCCTNWHPFKQYNSNSNSIYKSQAIYHPLCPSCCEMSRVYHVHFSIYCKTSSMSHTKFQNLIVTHLVLQLSMPNPLNPGIKSRMRM